MGTPRKHLEWRKIGEFFLLFLVLPTMVFHLLSLRWPVVLTIGYYFIVTIFVIQAALSYVQSAGALLRKPFRELPTARHQPIPKTTFIVCAYLPNEIEVIEATLLNILEKITRPADGIEVILSYNTPHMEGIEPRLKELAYQWPELILANAYGSRSKSENLNYALDIALRRDDRPPGCRPPAPARLSAAGVAMAR